MLAQLKREVQQMRIQKSNISNITSDSTAKGPADKSNVLVINNTQAGTALGGGFQKKKNYIYRGLKKLTHSNKSNCYF